MAGWLFGWCACLVLCCQATGKINKMSKMSYTWHMKTYYILWHAHIHILHLIIHMTYNIRKPPQWTIYNTSIDRLADWLKYHSTARQQSIDCFTNNTPSMAEPQHLHILYCFCVDYALSLRRYFNGQTQAYKQTDSQLVSHICMTLSSFVCFCILLFLLWHKTLDNQKWIQSHYATPRPR